MYWKYVLIILLDKDLGYKSFTKKTIVLLRKASNELLKLNFTVDYTIKYSFMKKLQNVQCFKVFVARSP